jgi:uncharacterized membrane protein YphA (DoxX/SURF4 family)
MDGIIKLGKYLFALPLIGFGAGHFMNADAMAGMAPFGGAIMIYITGLALIAGAVSIIIGKMDKLACVLLCLFLLSTAFLIFLPGMMDGDQTSMSMFMKDFAMAGGALGYAQLAKDNSVIG